MNQKLRIQKLIGLLLIFSSVLMLRPVALAQGEGDQDADGIMDALDRCPNIPANHSPSGCPVFERRRLSEENDGHIQVQWLQKRTDLRLHEKTELIPGDIIWAVIKNPRTGEIHSRSEPFEALN